MKLPATVGNPCLYVLLRGSGFSSLDQFATAVNRLAAERHGLHLKYDHSSVKRWLRGSSCEHHEIVAEVFTEKWGVPVPSEVIWPHAGDDPAWTIAHFLPSVAARSVRDLANFVRSDLLAQRTEFADHVVAVSGQVFVRPLGRWLDTPPYRLPLVEVDDGPSIDPDTVEELERATGRFIALAAAGGGGAVRDAAAGTLRAAADLLERDGRDDPSGNRMLAAVARLAGEIGVMSEDAGMSGPAQKYLVYGVQAARATTDRRGPFIAVEILTQLALQQGTLGRPADGLGVLDLAFERITARSRGCGPIRAMLWAVKAVLLARCEPERQSEAEHAVELAVSLAEQHSTDEVPEWIPALFRHLGARELHSLAASAWLALAVQTGSVDADVARGHAARAVESAGTALAGRPEPELRARAYAHVDRAYARFLLVGVDGACEDGERAVVLAGQVIGSVRLRARLRELLDPSHRYRDVGRMRSLRTAVTRAARPRALA